MSDSGPSGPDLQAFAVRLSELLGDGKGARVGETAVVSRRVHVVDASQPNDVQVRTPVRHSTAGACETRWCT